MKKALIGLAVLAASFALVSGASAHGSKHKNFADVTAGFIAQKTINRDSNVSNTSTINTHAITGDGISVSASASGATSVVSVTNINTYPATVKVGAVFQKTVNDNSSVVNKGTVTAHSVNGNGASISASTSGATSAVAVTALH